MDELEVKIKSSTNYKGQVKVSLISKTTLPLLWFQMNSNEPCKVSQRTKLTQALQRRQIIQATKEEFMMMISIKTKCLFLGAFSSVLSVQSLFLIPSLNFYLNWRWSLLLLCSSRSSGSKLGNSEVKWLIAHPAEGAPSCQAWFVIICHPRDR